MYIRTGKFMVQPHKLEEFVVPDLKDCEVIAVPALTAYHDPADKQTNCCCNRQTDRQTYLKMVMPFDLYLLQLTTIFPRQLKAFVAYTTPKVSVPSAAALKLQYTGATASL